MKGNFDKHTLQFRDKFLDLTSKTIIMGILNVTPDSFYDGGRYNITERALEHCEKMINDGADIIDIGGESTRPGSLPINEDEELKRVIPVIKEIKKRFNILLSIDTTKSIVSKEALEEGVDIVNDISGLNFEPNISGIVAKYKAAIILSHTTSRSVDMQQKTDYDDFLGDVYSYLQNSIKLAENAGINKDSIIIDPGFGFGKTVKHNLMLLKHLSVYTKLTKPIMVGTSMKSFIGKILNSNKIEDRLEGTIASLVISVLNDASIIRVHNVKQANKAIKIVDAVKYLN